MAHMLWLNIFSAAAAAAVGFLVNMLTPREHGSNKRAILAAMVTLIVIQAFLQTLKDSKDHGGQPEAQQTSIPTLSGDPSTASTATSPVPTTTVPTTVPTPTVTKAAQPEHFKVPVLEVLGFTGGVDSTITVGNNIFRATVNGTHGTSMPVVGSTCSSMTLTAGIDNDDPFGDSSRLVVQVEAGRPGGGSITVRKGQLATKTFRIEPGNFQIAFFGAPVTQLNGYAQCTTPTGTSTAQ